MSGIVRDIILVGFARFLVEDWRRWRRQSKWLDEERVLDGF